MAVVVGCSPPAGMRVLGERDGLPPLPALEIALAWGARPPDPRPLVRLAEQIHNAVGPPEGARGLSRSGHCTAPPASRHDCPGRGLMMRSAGSLR